MAINRKWCYVLDATGVTGLTSFDGSEVGTPKLHHLYSAANDNSDLADDGTGKLYTAANGAIEPSDLQNRIDNYTPIVVTTTKAKTTRKKKPKTTEPTE